MHLVHIDGWNRLTIHVRNNTRIPGQYLPKCLEAVKTGLFGFKLLTRLTDVLTTETFRITHNLIQPVHVDPYCRTHLELIQNTDFLECRPSPISTHLTNIFSLLK